MSHFDYTRPAGVWGGFVPVLASEFADLDRKTFKAINGDEGGTWAPTSPIAIGGAGLEIGGAGIDVVSLIQWRTSGATASFRGNTTLNFWAATGTETIGAQATFYGNGATGLKRPSMSFLDGALAIWNNATANFNNGARAEFEVTAVAQFKSGAKAVFASGATAEIQSGAIADFKPGAKATFDGGHATLEARAEFVGVKAIASFTAGATATFSGLSGITASGVVFAADSRASFGSGSEALFFGTAKLRLLGTTTFESSGTHELKGPLVASGQGRVTKRVANGPDANATFGVNDTDVVYVVAINANRTYTITSAGAKEGDAMRVLLHGANGESKLKLVADGGGTIVTLGAPFNSGSYVRSVELLFHDGGWTPIAWSRDTPF